MCLVYSCLIRMHPRQFRKKYGREMLWIYEQEAGGRRAGLLLADAVVSLVRQWGFRKPAPIRPAALGGGPTFATCGDDMPRPSALFHGALATVLAFGVVSMAINHGGYRQRAGRRPVRILPAQQMVTPSPAAAETEVAAKQAAPGESDSFGVGSVLGSIDILAAPGILLELSKRLGDKLIADVADRPAVPARTAMSVEELIEALMAYDRSGDGTLQRIETPPHLLGLFALLDLNRDGVLTSSEIRRAAR
jgi:hypothetical protein